MRVLGVASVPFIATGSKVIKGIIIGNIDS